MLVYTRKMKEKIIIADDIVLTVLRIKGDRVMLGFELPTEMPIGREEFYAEIREEFKGWVKKWLESREINKAGKLERNLNKDNIQGGSSEDYPNTKLLYSYI